jgi:hypothetical protein
MIGFAHERETIGRREEYQLSWTDFDVPSVVDLDKVILGRNFAVASLSGDSDGRGPGSFTADRPYRE